MDDKDLGNRIAGMSDVDLVRLLTVNAREQRPEVLALAEAEANRRGVPIDEAFIPPSEPDEAAGPVVEGTEALGPSRFSAGGQIIVCSHCGSEKFTSREIRFTTRGLTFLSVDWLGLDWLNRSATALVCTRCSLVQLFTQPPQPEDDEAA